MAKTILQTATFAASPERLFRLYMNPREHAAATGMRGVRLGRRPGSRFRVGTSLAGRVLAVVPERLIVQTWRGTAWTRGEPDSIVVLTFERARGGGRVNLVHANIPHRHYRGIVARWPTYYWRPWKTYLGRRT